MFLSGLQLTIAGMSVVFGFLVIMVLTINLMSAVVLKYFPEREQESVADAVQEDDAIIAAIVAAVKPHTR